MSTPLNHAFRFLACAIQVDGVKSTAPPASATTLKCSSWLGMRLSGVVLVVLIFGHLFVNLMVGDGIHAIDFRFRGR